MEDHKECNTLSRNVHIVQCHARLSEISYDTGLPPELNHIVVNYVVGHGVQWRANATFPMQFSSDGKTVTLPRSSTVASNDWYVALGCHPLDCTVSSWSMQVARSDTVAVGIAKGWNLSVTEIPYPVTHADSFAIVSNQPGHLWHERKSTIYDPVVREQQEWMQKTLEPALEELALARRDGRMKEYMQRHDFDKPLDLFSGLAALPPFQTFTVHVNLVDSSVGFCIDGKSQGTLIRDVSDLQEWYPYIAIQRHERQPRPSATVL